MYHELSYFPELLGSRTHACGQPRTESLLSFPNLFLSSDMGRRIVQDILGSDVKASADSSFLQV